MKNRYRVWFGILLSAAVTCINPVFSQFIPLDIEKERVNPQGKIELPKIQTEPDVVDYFFEPEAGSVKPGEKYPMAHMRIPKAPYFEMSSPNEPVRFYEIGKKY